MKLITIVDNNNGLSFLNKRLSRDKILYKYIDNLFTKFTVQENKLSNKHVPTFKNSTNEQTDILFVETGVNDIFNKYSVDELYLFNWNRDYPSTEKLDINLSDFKIKYIDEFKGSSHEKITLTVYERN